MNERKIIARELGEIEQALKELEVTFEQYFAGVEKRAPIKDRDNLQRRLLRFANRRITQTDLRFRYQNLATRFHQYCGHWDRILRLIDEGRYQRHLTKTKSPAAVPKDTTAPAAVKSQAESELERIYGELLAAREGCRLTGAAPERAQVAAFLDGQREKIREKFGDREVEFRVAIEEGKPKIKVRAKT
ncbi:MAG: MXAN_5187 C-terminal domain-containing protein [Trichloromonadaceae bacterium]